MAETTALILSDGEVLQHVCGANDQNLRYLEEIFEAPVRVRGNELRLEGAERPAQDHFAELIGELERHSRDGRRPDRTLIRSLHHELTGRDRDGLASLGRTSIDIPVAGSRVFPRTARQAVLIERLDRAQLNFLVGPAGTGKTFLAVAHALREVLSKRKRRLILTRPVVEAGESLGFLPGDLTQKISPYLRPLYDAMQALIPHELVRKLEENRVIEIAPLAYMRGRSLRDSYVILDEAQNTTREQMKMFLTRLGEESQAVITGDITQVDLPQRTASGLVHAIEILQGVEDIEITRLQREDVVRSRLVQRIIQAYDDREQ